MCLSPPLWGKKVRKRQILRYHHAVPCIPAPGTISRETPRLSGAWTFIGDIDRTNQTSCTSQGLLPSMSRASFPWRLSLSDFSYFRRPWPPDCVSLRQLGYAGRQIGIVERGEGSRRAWGHSWTFGVLAPATYSAPGMLEPPGRSWVALVALAYMVMCKNSVMCKNINHVTPRTRDRRGQGGI